MRIPGDDAPALAWLIFEQSGVLTWAQATAELTPATVRHLLTSGRWHRICRGILRASADGTVFSREQQWWIAVLAAGEGTVLAGLAAAHAAGLRGSWRYDVVDVLVPHRRPAAPAAAGTAGGTGTPDPPPAA